MITLGGGDCSITKGQQRKAAIGTVSRNQCEAFERGSASKQQVPRRAFSTLGMTELFQKIGKRPACSRISVTCARGPRDQFPSTSPEGPGIRGPAGTPAHR